MFVFWYLCIIGTYLHDFAKHCGMEVSSWVTHTSWQLQGIVDWHFVFFFPKSRPPRNLHYLATSPHHAYTQNPGYSQTHKALSEVAKPKLPLRKVLVIAMLPDFSRLFAFAFVFTSGCVYLCFSFAFYFWWMGSHPWFLFIGVFFLTC
jgi:hypothetical protein